LRNPQNIADIVRGASYLSHTLSNEELLDSLYHWRRALNITSSSFLHAYFPFANEPYLLLCRWFCYYRKPGKKLISTKFEEANIKKGGEEKERWLEEASTMHDWVVWCRSKKGAEAIRSFELSRKEIFFIMMKRN